MGLFDFIKSIPISTVFIIAPLIAGVCPMILLLYLFKPDLFITSSISKIIVLSLSMSLPIQSNAIYFSIANLMIREEFNKPEEPIFVGAILAFGEISLVAACAYAFRMSLYLTLCVLIAINFIIGVMGIKYSFQMDRKDKTI